MEPSYRNNTFPALLPEERLDQDDPLIMLAGDDADSIKVIYQPYVEKWVPRVEAWAALGAQPQEVDALLSLKPGTMVKVMKLFPALYNAWAYGFQVAKQQLLDSAFRRALDGDVKLTQFMLQNVYGVKEKKEIDINQNITIVAEIGANGEVGKRIMVEDIRGAIDAEVVMQGEDK
jgi:hypothetical protein